jgi:hypothetical protein
MAGYANMIGSFGQVITPPHNVRLQAVNQILNKVQINPGAGHGICGNYQHGDCCSGGSCGRKIV